LTRKGKQLPVPFFASTSWLVATSEPLVERFEVAVMTEIKQPAHA
jgi:hypothetical protein